MNTPRRTRLVLLRGVFRSCGALGAAIVFAACSPNPVQVLEIERLAFVPGGQIRVSGGRMGASGALLVDRFETTRDLWARFLKETDRGDWVGEDLFQTPPGERHLGELPAVGMDWEEAKAYAAWRGMRLPEVAEWLWIAAGPRAQAYPYGTSPADSAANTTELGLLAPTPVGTFFNGRTPGDAIYDLEGNVSEWVRCDFEPGSPWIPRTARAGSHLQISSWAIGGSFLTHSRPLFLDSIQGIQVNGLELPPGTRANDVGVRPVIEARTWLLANMSTYSRDAHKARLVAVGKAWGNRSVNLLSDLQEEHPNEPMLNWLLEGARGQ
ncbi:MAG: SUMF1/EgtB/PvdO family nonheme iron enzyme [Planctomycetota bacterium]|nr:SUMF1/EgtB/PvdO family nonheme iron enzyme [Planctomycetota bacterium]